MYSYTYIHTHICIILDGKLLKTFHRVKHLKRVRTLTIIITMQSVLKLQSIP